MSKFLTKYNIDDVYFRVLTVAILNYMTDKIVLWNIKDGIRKEYSVPFYYNAGGDERFMQDIFQQHSLNDCITEKVVEGNSDVIPRGHITLTEIGIAASSLSNRFVRGKWIREEGDDIVTYNSPMNVIPIDLTYECEIHVDSKLMSFKILQGLIQTFYKRGTIEFLWEGMPLKAYIAFPENNSFEHIHEFSFGDDTQNKITFTVEVQTNMIVMDKTQTFKESNSIEEFIINSSVGPVFWPNKDLDRANIYDEETEQSIKDRIVTINADYIPEQISDASRIKYMTSLNGNDSNLSKDYPSGTSSLISRIEESKKKIKV